MIKLVNLLLSLLCIIFIFILFFTKNSRENFESTTPCPNNLTTAVSGGKASITNYSFCIPPLTYTFEKIKEVLPIDETNIHNILNDHTNKKKHILDTLNPEILKNMSSTNYFYRFDDALDTAITIKYDNPKKNVFTIAFRIIPLVNIINLNINLLDDNSKNYPIKLNKEPLNQNNLYNVVVNINTQKQNYSTYINGIIKKDEGGSFTSLKSIQFIKDDNKKVNQFYLGDIMFVNENINYNSLFYDYKNPNKDARRYYDTCLAFNPFLKNKDDKFFSTYDECVNTCFKSCNDKKLCQNICMDCNKYLWDDEKRNEYCPWLENNRIGKIIKNEIRANGGNKQISINWYRPDSPRKITDYIIIVSESSDSSGDRIHKIKDNENSNQQVYIIKNLLNNKNYSIKIKAIVIENNKIIMAGPQSDSLTVMTIGNEEEDDSYIYEEDYSHLDEDLSCNTNFENHILDTYKPKDIDIEYSIKKFINQARDKSNYILQ